MRDDITPAMVPTVLYTVKVGDTLPAILAKFGMPPNRMMDLFRTNPRKEIVTWRGQPRIQLVVGEKLSIPPCWIPRSYWNDPQAKVGVGDFLDYLTPCKDGYHRSWTGECVSDTRTEDTIVGCPQGYHRNPVTGLCDVTGGGHIDESGFCPSGFEMNAQGICQEVSGNIPVCGLNQRWDSSLKKCVDTSNDFVCAPGGHYDNLKRRCVYPADEANAILVYSQNNPPPATTEAVPAKKPSSNTGLLLVGAAVAGLVVLAVMSSKP